MLSGADQIVLFVEDDAELRAATAVLQHAFRAYIAAQAVMRADAAARRLQAVVRGYLVRQRYMAVRAGIVSIQSVWRGYRCV